jgi:hypothetical protein
MPLQCKSTFSGLPQMLQQNARPPPERPYMHSLNSQVPLPVNPRSFLSFCPISNFHHDLALLTSFLSSFSSHQHHHPGLAAPASQQQPAHSPQSASQHHPLHYPLPPLLHPLLTSAHHPSPPATHSSASLVFLGSVLTARPPLLCSYCI